MSEVIVIASGKGGVGKTVFATNLGTILAQRGARVVMIDMNIGLRSLDICFGLENRIVYDLTDAVTGICPVKKALVKDRRFEELYLISTPQSRTKPIVTSEQLKTLCQELKEDFEYIIIDAPAGIDEGFLLSVAPADRAVIITVPEHAAIRDADLLDGVFNELGINKKCVIVNKIMSGLFKRGIVPDPLDIAENLRVPILGLIPFDENIHISANIGIPIVMAKGNYIERNFSLIADRIINI
jgi:septum site-determining protein MinD